MIGDFMRAMVSVCCSVLGIVIFSACCYGVVDSTICSSSNMLDCAVLFLSLT
jgi:hypothetical protein